MTDLTEEKKKAEKALSELCVALDDEKKKVSGLCEEMKKKEKEASDLANALESEKKKDDDLKRANGRKKDRNR